MHQNAFRVDLKSRHACKIVPKCAPICIHNRSSPCAPFQKYRNTVTYQTVARPAVLFEGYGLSRRRYPSISEHPRFFYSSELCNVSISGDVNGLERKGRSISAVFRKIFCHVVDDGVMM